MFLETVKSEGLAHLSYVVGDGGRAAVIDPRRDCDVYEAIARAHDARITHVIETHRNEDYVIGSTELRRRTGARILHGPHLPFGYGDVAREGDEVEIGKVLLRVIETPGHTFESISITVTDRATGDDPFAVFTGDCLFVGDVGRTDLVPEGREREAAERLYVSLFEKLLPLGDHVIVHPAHGAGSVCGSDMAERDLSTIGFERMHNPALSARSRDDFVERKLAETHDRPPYFRRMEELNLEGAPPLERLPRPVPIDPGELAARMRAGTVLVDVRSPEAWLGASVPGSVAIPLPMLASWAGWLLDYDRDIALVAEEGGAVEQAVRHLVRLGYDRVTAYLAGGVSAWATSGRPVQSVGGLDTAGVAKRLDEPDTVLLDVRRRSELEAARIPGAEHLFLGDLPHRLADLPRDRRIVAFCGSGRRSTVAASLLARAGFDRIEVWLGSIQAARAAGAPIVEA